MKNRNLRMDRAGKGLLLVSLFGLALAVFMPVRAQEGAGTPESQPGQPGMALLEYKEVAYSYNNWGPPVDKRKEPFAKEPAWGGNKVSRGFVSFQGVETNRLAFAWDRTAGKLYLDLNGNLNLTDDGVFSAGPGPQRSFQNFANVRLPFKTAVGIRPMLLDISMHDYGRLSCSLAMKSCWQGKVTLQGKDWQLGLLPQPLQQLTSWENGYLLLRPWSDHAKAFSQHNQTGEIVGFSRKLFLDGHAYQLRCSDEGSGEAAKVRVRFTELQPKLGEVKLAGSLIHRLTFVGGDYRVILNDPGETVKLPVGSYGPPEVCLQKGTTEARLDRNMNPSGRLMGLTVDGKVPAVLEVGGPLTNSVSVRKQGKYLSMNYQLKGAGGDYQLVFQDRQHPPEFMVYKGDRKVASGKFEYG